MPTPSQYCGRHLLFGKSTWGRIIQGRLSEAEPLYLRALAIREEQLGSDHPATARSLNNLATLYKDQNKYTEAEPLYLRALAISEHCFGPSHPQTLAIQKNYASLLQAMEARERDDVAE